MDKATYEAMIADGSMRRLLVAINAHGYTMPMTPPTYEELTAGGALQASALRVKSINMVDPNWLERAMCKNEGPR